MRARVLAPLLTLFALLPAAHAQEATALRQGNQAFRAGRLEEAIDAYDRGWAAGGRDPVLAYNLGTTAHHLGRLPEAVLWYRRALPGLAGDRWIEENLALARSGLEAPRLEPAGAVGFFSRYQRAWLGLGVILAWGTLVAHLARRRSSHLPPLLADALALAAVVFFAAGLLLARFGPGPAVVLEPCGEGEIHLAAGSEVWVRPAAEKGWRVDTPDGPLFCLPGAIARIRP